MATKIKGLKGCIDDVFGDLLGDDTTSPEKPVEPAPYNRDARDVPQKLPSSKARGRSFGEDEIFDTSGGLAGADAEASDISDANPQALLQAIKDLDDMDADLLGLKKSPASDRRVAKGSGKEELPLHPEPAGKLTANEKDLEEPLAGLLSDDEEGIARKPPVTESKTTCNKTPSTVRGPGKAGRLVPHPGRDCVDDKPTGPEPSTRQDHRSQVQDQETVSLWEQGSGHVGLRWSGA